MDQLFVEWTQVIDLDNSILLTNHHIRREGSIPLQRVTTAFVSQ